MSESLQVVYDMQMNPASYDFLPFLAAADKHRSHHGLPHMDVHLMAGDGARFYEAYYPKGES